jgi:hypothetical protein
MHATKSNAAPKLGQQKNTRITLDAVSAGTLVLVWQQDILVYLEQTTLHHQLRCGAVWKRDG